MEYSEGIVLRSVSARNILIDSFIDGELDIVVQNPLHSAGWREKFFSLPASNQAEILQARFDQLFEDYVLITEEYRLSVEKLKQNVYFADDRIDELEKQCREKDARIAALEAEKLANNAHAQAPMKAEIATATGDGDTIVAMNKSRNLEISSGGLPKEDALRAMQLQMALSHLRKQERNGSKLERLRVNVGLSDNETKLEICDVQACNQAYKKHLMCSVYFTNWKLNAMGKTKSRDCGRNEKRYEYLRDQLHRMNGYIDNANGDEENLFASVGLHLRK
jgi:hypothetical protein